MRIIESDELDIENKSLYSKYMKGEITYMEYRNKLVKKKGYRNYDDYKNELVKKKGFKDLNEYNKEMKYKRGENLPMSENKDCGLYLGVYICENKEFLSKIINVIESMKCNNPGYDIVCGKGKKIDVKCSCLRYDKEWGFAIRKNKVADYFLMIAFDNIENLNIMHIWLVKSDSSIEKTKIHLSNDFIFNEKDIVSISKGNRALKRWKKYEITDSYKLEKVQKVCDNFKNNNKYEIGDNNV